MANIESLNRIKYLSSLVLGTVLLLGVFYFFYEITNRKERTNIENPQKKSNSCGEEDGDHLATATYYNLETGYQTKYKVKVTVKGCRIIFIDFKRGWFDDKQAVFSELKSNQNATITDEQGEKYEIHIDD